jgi:hypothetical protein
MLLEITTTAKPATDLGYLLHKHPERLQDSGKEDGSPSDESRAVRELLDRTFKLEE